MSDELMVSDTYRQHIEQLAEGDIDETISNSDMEHAIVLVSRIIKGAQNYVHILCENMNSVATSRAEYLVAIELFLSGDRNRKMKILFADYNKNSFNKSKVATLLKKYKEQVEMKRLKKHIKVHSNNSPINWTVCDDKSYRLETDPKKYRALGNFNDPVLAKSLNNKFEKLFCDDSKTQLLTA